jgi:hypothetical protein
LPRGVKLVFIRERGIIARAKFEKGKFWSMPRTSRRQKKKWSRAQIVNLILGSLVALSMVLGSVFVFGGAASQPTPAPYTPFVVPSDTPVPPTVTSGTDTPAVTPTTTTAPTTAPPTPTPQASAPPGNAVLTFAVAGDSRDGDVFYQRVLTGVPSDGSEFLIHLGDLVPTGVESEWLHFRDLMRGFNLPFYPVAGNHDAASAPMDLFLKYSGAPAAHYAFERGSVHFTLLDSHAGGISASELAFLENDLAASKQPIKMVFLHHPPFDPAGGSHVMAYGNADFMRAVERYRVNYVFAAHIHCYAEGERNGVKYIVTGGAGAPLYCPADAGGFYHYVRVTVKGEQATTTVVKLEE